jgi:CheY-like chemotaxis protein
MIETRNATVEPDADFPVPDLPPGEYATVIVSDTGTGIAPEHIDKVFEPFFTTKEDKGSGLGLAGAYGIVKNAGGRISVYSEVGHGTMFRVYLPATQRAGGSPARREAAAAGRGSETVLVAEDNAQVRAVIEQTLRHYGYSVLSAKNGIEAIELATGFSGTIDLLVTDLVMPKMGGTELAEALTASRPKMKVIFLSGYTEETVSSSGVEGVTGAFLQKPVLPTDLAAKVREVLDGSLVRE